MARMLALASRAWPECSLEDFARKAAEWGYQAVELPADGELLSPRRALAEPDYAPKMLAALAKPDLKPAAFGVHALSRLLGDRLDNRHAKTAPAAVWGDGAEPGVKARAAEELKTTAKAAQSLGVNLLVGSTGSLLASALFEPPPREIVARTYQAFADTWSGLLDCFADAGVRFAQEVQPGQLAFDLHSAEAALKAVGHHEGFGFALNPGALFWQGVDPVEFVRAFPDRILHVYLKDAAVTLNGRSGILNSHLPSGDPRRGWDWRQPGMGGVDWPSLIRALNQAGFAALTADPLDPDVDRDWAAAETAGFARRIDFEPAGGLDPAFTDGD